MLKRMVDGIRKMFIEKYIKRRLGYTDEEMISFRKNPRNEEVISKARYLMAKTIVAEIVASHGCNSQHRVGDQFFFDGFGNLITEKSPRRICIYALNAITPQIFAVTELIYAGVDPDEMRFKRAACFDVGLECGGFGRIVMEIKVHDKMEESQEVAYDLRAQ